MVIARNMTNNIVVEEAFGEQHAQWKIKRLSKDMEKMKRKHEEEIKELQALCVENTLIRHNMNNKRPILFTPTKPKPTKQP